MNSVDPRKDPCENFYEYACNGWIKKHPVDEETFMLDQWSLLQKKVDVFIKDSLNDEDIRKDYENVRIQYIFVRGREKGMGDGKESHIFWTPVDSRGACKSSTEIKGSRII